MGNKAFRQFRILQKEISGKYNQIEEIIDKISRLEKRNTASCVESEKIDLDSQIKELTDKKKSIEDEIKELEKKKDDLESPFTDQNKDAFRNKSEDANELNEVESGVKEEFGKRSTKIIPLDDKGRFSELKQVFQEGAEIEITLIYVATFFEGLSANEFNEVVSSFLKSKTIEVVIEKEFITPKGKVKSLQKKEDRKALEVWESSLDKPDRYLKKCALKSVKNGQCNVIDFAPSALRTEMQIYLKEEQPLYLDLLLEKAKLFMFHRHTQIAKGGLTILTDAMLTYPTVYNEEWLIQILEVLAPQNSNDLSLLMKLQQLITKLDTGQIEIRQFDKISSNQWVFSRFAGLIYFMLSNNSLEPTVKKFLDALMEQKRYDAVSEIVNNLDNVKEFNSLYWIKRLLDNATEEATVIAYKVLHRRLKGCGSRIYEELDSLYKWLPNSDTKYSNSAEIALGIVVGYFSNSTLDFPDEKYGLYKSEYVLFKYLYKEEDSRFFFILFRWVFATDEKGDLAINNISDEDFDEIEFIGEMIAEWFLILYGFNDVPTQENLVVIEVMITEIVKVLYDRPMLLEDLAQVWKDLVSYYLYLINRLPKTRNRRRYKKLVKSRNALRKLNKQFKYARKAHH